MKLTTKVLKEMIRKELKENMMGNKAGYHGRSLGMGPQVDINKEDETYKMIKGQMEDHYYGYLGGGFLADGEEIPEQEVRKELGKWAAGHPDIQSEEILISLISDIMTGE
jgi:hypothetical protein